MADFLEEKKTEISKRMQELRPAVDEYQRLEAAHRALAGVGSQSTTGAAGGGSATRTRRRGGGSGSGARGGRRGRPKGTGTRAKEALALVTGQPGITIPEMAQKMGIQQNYLYRVLPGLEQDGQVRKEGRGWFPKNGT